MKDYHINVFYCDQDGCYIADIPDLKFCSACGASAEEAVREVQVAKAAWLKVARDRGNRSQAAVPSGDLQLTR